MSLPRLRKMFLLTDSWLQLVTLMLPRVVLTKVVCEIPKYFTSTALI